MPLSPAESVFLFVVLYSLGGYALRLFVSWRASICAVELFTRPCALTSLGRTGADLARAYLRAHHIAAEVVSFEVDGYQCDPPALLLCKGVYSGTSLGAAAHALHECAHAVLQHTKRTPLLLAEYSASRRALVFFRGAEYLAVRRLFVWYWLTYFVDMLTPFHRRLERAQSNKG